MIVATARSLLVARLLDYNLYLLWILQREKRERKEREERGKSQGETASPAIASVGDTGTRKESLGSFFPLLAIIAGNLEEASQASGGEKKTCRGAFT